MTDISETARTAYAAGIDPVDHAEHEITVLIGVHRQLAAQQAAFGLAPDAGLADGPLARRVLGLLLNAGWKQPGDNDPLEEL